MESGIMPGKVEGRILELKSAFDVLDKEINEAIQGDGVVIDGSEVEVKEETAEYVQKRYEKMSEIEGLVKAAYFGSELKSFFEEPKGNSAAIAAGADNSHEAKTLGEMFIGSQEFKDFRGTGRMTMDRDYEVQEMDLTAMGRKDVWTGSVPGTTTLGFGRHQRDPMVPRAQRQYRVRDLFPVVGTDANLIDFFRVTGYAAGGGAKSVRERAAADGVSAPTGGATDTFGLKPRTSLQFEAAQAPVRTIAHYEVAHRNVLSDEPQLRGTIDNELLYGLALEEDRQILSGSGANEELLGLLVTAGIQGYTQANNATVATEPKSDALRRAATKAVLANYAPTGYVLHPNDWEDIELQKATGDGQYMLVTNIAVGAGATAWRQPVVETPAMPEGTFLTGAFGLAAQLYDRMQANIRIAEQHADFFIRNAVVILAEERLALAVKRPEAFVKGTFFGA